MIPTFGYAVGKEKDELKLYHFSRREPGPNDVQIDIKFCGVCHSDIHLGRGEWGGDGLFPMVPGHEIVGQVKKVGNQVQKFKQGDFVGVGCMVDSCQSCEYCQKSEEQFCEKYTNWTYNAKEKDGKTVCQGGYSTCIVVNENFVLRLPENVELASTAPLLCAGITTYSPLKYWGAGPGKKVGVVGLGGLGHMAVKIGSALGADVTLLSHSEKKKEDAFKFGAKDFFNTSDKETFKKLHKFFDLIICTVSADVDWNAYLELLRVDGAMVLVGVPENAVPMKAGSLIHGRRCLTGSSIGGIKETQEMLDFCAEKKITSDIELITIQEINKAWERVVHSDVKYRFVIDISSLYKEHQQQ